MKNIKCLIDTETFNAKYKTDHNQIEPILELNDDTFHHN